MPKVVKIDFYDDITRSSITGEREGFVPIPINGYNPTSLARELTNDTIWGEYLTSCIRTWNKRSPALYQIPNAVLGLIGEVAEYLQAPSIDEFGDILYYRAILRWLLGDETMIYPDNEVAGEFRFDEFTLFIADFGKKAVYHDKMNDVKTIGKYFVAMNMLDAFICNELTNRFNLMDFKFIFRENITKLEKRHIKGFNPNHDNNV